MTKALLVPAGELSPVSIVDIGRPSQHLRKLQELVGGTIEHVQYDEDADGFVDGEGVLKHRALNYRATEYIFRQSDAAKQGRITEADRGLYGLFGDVVFTGLEDRHGHATDVPQRVVEAFGLSLDQSPDLSL